MDVVFDGTETNCVARSNSLYRSAAALSALIRLSTSDVVYGEFYVSVAAVEHIFHLETIAARLDDSHPEKKFFHFLTGLAQAQLHYISRVRIHIDETAPSSRRGLLKILESCRCVPLSIRKGHPT